MSEYVADLQNPDYRAETESYISELEGDGKVPEGKELIRPNPGFVAKTYKVTPGGADRGDKVFVNFVSSAKIAQPTSVNSEKGQSWSIPYSVGPPHMENDKNGTSAAAFDVCFHPEALRLSEANKRFRDMLVRTGVDGVQQAYRAQKQDVTLSQDFHVLKGVQYKQGLVPTMLIDKSARDQKWGAESAPEPELVPDALPSGPTPAKSTSVNKPAQHVTTVKQGGRESVIKKGFLSADKARPALYPEGSAEGAPAKPPPTPLISELRDVCAAQAPKRSSAPEPAVEEASILKERSTTRRAHPISPLGDKLPAYRMKERGVISMGDFEGVSKASGVAVESNRCLELCFMTSPYNSCFYNSFLPYICRPAELVYTVELPLVTKPSKVQLDVSERCGLVAVSLHNMNQFLI